MSSDVQCQTLDFSGFSCVEDKSHQRLPRPYACTETLPRMVVMSKTFVEHPAKRGFGLDLDYSRSLHITRVDARLTS